MTSNAKESKQVEKARKKLKLRIQKEHELATEAALQKVSTDIKNWISRHSQERIKLRQKGINLFDENRHPAKVHSHYVKHRLQELAKSIPPKTENSLDGRVTEI